MNYVNIYIRAVHCILTLKFYINLSISEICLYQTSLLNCTQKHISEVFELLQVVCHLCIQLHFLLVGKSKLRWLGP